MNDDYPEKTFILSNGGFASTPILGSSHMKFFLKTIAEILSRREPHFFSNESGGICGIAKQNTGSI